MAYNYEYPYVDPNRYNADWLVKSWKDLSRRVDTIEEEFAKIKILTEDYIQQMIDTSISEFNLGVVQPDLQDLYNKVTNEYKVYIAGELATQKIYIDSQDQAYYALAKDYTDQREIVIRQYIQDILYNYLYMLNPFTGQEDDVRNVVDYMINNFFRADAITAGAYDALNYTATAYDALNITAYNYDFNAKNIL